jgi:hypothetical protein
MTEFNEAIKIEIFIPESHLSPLQKALGENGIGKIGNYDHCLSITNVTGTWRPLEGAEPYDGKIGEVSYGQELKIEVNCPRELLPVALRAIRKVHPYEEPVINLVPLLNHLYP